MAIVFAILLALMLVFVLGGIAWTIYYTWQREKDKPLRTIPKERYPMIGCALAAMGAIIVAMIVVAIAGIVLLLGLHKLFG